MKRMKRIKRAWAVLLCLCVAISLFPTTVFAADLSVTVNGTTVTSENAANVLGDGTVSYDANTNTLTLKDANLKQIQNNTGKDFTIKLSGTNTVAITSGSTNLIETNAPLTITGDSSASLKLSGVDQNSYITCIDAKGSVTVECVTLILTNSNNAGISTTGDITIKEGATVKGDTGNMFYATTTGAGKLTIQNSAVIAPLDGTTVSGWMSAWVNEIDIFRSSVDITAPNGIYAANNIVIRDFSCVNVTASGVRTPYPGIFAGNSMTIAEHSRVKGVSYTYSGLYAKNDLTITDSNVEAVTTSSDYAAMSAGNALKIRGGVVITTEDNGGGSYNGNVTFNVKVPDEPAGAVYDVCAGESPDDNEIIKGSPFETGADITEYVKDSAYFSLTIHHIHRGGNATCSSRAICEECGKEYGAVAPTNHTNLQEYKKTPATHLKEGNTAYWHCDGCGKYFSDKVATTEITLADTVIAKLTEHTADTTKWTSDETNHWNECECGEELNTVEHTFKWVIDKEATTTEKGEKHEECEVCGYKKAAVEIPATGGSSSGGSTSGTTAGETSPDAGATTGPATGDNSNLFLWTVLLFVSCFGIVGATIYGKRKRAK